MRQRTNLIILASILSGLVIIFVLSFVFSSEARLARKESLSMFGTLKASMVSSIVLQDGVTLIREGADWKVVEGEKTYPGNPARASTLIDVLLENKTAKTMTTRKEKWSEFGVDSDPSIILQDLNGKAYSMFVGDSGTAGQGDYVRIEGNDTVYLVQPEVSFYVDQSKTYWYDLKVNRTGLESSSVSRIEVNGDVRSEQGESYILFRDRTNAWKLESDQAAEMDPAKIDQMVQALVSLEATSFAESDFDPRLVIQIDTGSNKTYVYRFGSKSESGSYSAKIDGSEYLYAVSNYNFERCVKPLSDLRK